MSVPISDSTSARWYRLTSAWVVPARSANSDWVRPAVRRASRMIDHAGHQIRHRPYGTRQNARRTRTATPRVHHCTRPKGRRRPRRSTSTESVWSASPPSTPRTTHSVSTTPNSSTRSETSQNPVASAANTSKPTTLPKRSVSRWSATKNAGPCPNSSSTGTRSLPSEPAPQTQDWIRGRPLRPFITRS